MSLPEPDLLFLDRYASAHGGQSRSATVQQAIALLRASELSDAYVDAWQEWSEHGEAEAWESTIGDGLHGDNATR